MPNYIAKKSIVATLSPFKLLIAFIILLFTVWLIFPIVIFAVIIILKILDVKSETIEFYDDRIVRKHGILSKKETQSLFMGVYAISLSQTLFGRLFDYGDIIVDVPGKWDISTKGIKDPNGLKSYLETRIAARNTTNIVF